MCKSIFGLLVLLLTVFVISCNDQSIDPNSVVENSNYENSSLFKTVWTTSDVLDWDTYTYWDNLYQTWITALEPDYDFTFNSYNYHLEYSCTGSGTHTNTVTISVNNTYCSSIVWTNTDGDPLNSRWLGWHSFSYNGVSMQLNIYVDEHYAGLRDASEPRQVQVKILEILAPDVPTSFSVTPTLHDNLSQTVSVSWDASTDSDVSGYEIYRKKFYLAGGVLKYLDYTLVQTITSRTISSWSDNPLWGPPRGGIGYYYKIRAIDNTHNLQSSFSSSQNSNLEDYDNILP